MNKRLVECKECCEEVDEGDALNGYCPECVERFEQIEKIKDWRRRLHSGDEVIIDTGDNELPPSIIISQIQYFPDDGVEIVTAHGEKINCLLSQIK